MFVHHELIVSEEDKHVKRSLQYRVAITVITLCFQLALNLFGQEGLQEKPCKYRGREGGDPDGGLVVYKSPEENIKEKAKMRWGGGPDHIQIYIAH